jgi:hypothetical protein
VCPSPPPACVDSYITVVYLAGQCVSGFCVWQKSDLDCRAVDASCGGAAGIDGGIDSGADGGVLVNVSGCLLLAPVGPNPAPLACDADASAATGECPLPPSACADSRWLVYYDDGQCIAGSCSWKMKDSYCSLGCSQGACGSIGTVPPGP